MKQAITLGGLACLLAAVALFAPVRSPAGLSLKLMTYNIGDLARPLPGIDQLLATIRGQGVPDVLFLQEVPGEKTAALLSQKLGLPSFVYANYLKNSAFGLAILSREPLTAREPLYFSASQMGRGALMAEIPIGAGRKLTVATVHMDHIEAIKREPPEIRLSWSEAATVLGKELVSESVRSRSAAELLEWLKLRGTDPLVIGGDFNTIPFSRTIRMIEAHLQDALWPSFAYFKGSYWKTSLPLRPRIDFIFHSAEVSVQEATVAPESPGDHLPVVARVTLN